MQTKSSYRTLKWAVFMGFAATLASACVVSSGDGDDDDVIIDGGDNGTGNTGNKAGTGGKSGAGTGGSAAGTSGSATAGTGMGGEGGTPAVDDPDYPGACDSELKTPSIEGSCAESANDNACGACLKANCCETFGACYGKAPTSACGYGPSPANDLGQFDKMLACYTENNDGIKSIDDILRDCDAEAFNQCSETDGFLNEDTMDLLDCAQNGDGTSDDCLDVCFPPAE